MKVVVIGYGSIGKRHVKNLISLGVSKIFLFRVSGKGNDLNLIELTKYDDIIKISPDFVIVSNPTASHFLSLKFLIQNKFNILCEKPLLYKSEEWNVLKPLLKKHKSKSYVAFNLRYHPCVKKVKELLSNNILGKINSSRFFVGQYLPDWRPKSDHLLSYSASKKMGGGVVMDLIHEIDLAEYLLGKPNGKIQSIVRKVSDITVDSPDLAEILYETKSSTVVSIHMDYLYRGYSRNFSINGKMANLHCDLFENTIEITGNENKQIEYFEFKDFKKNDMYFDLIKDYIEQINNKNYKSNLPSFSENKTVMQTSFKINK